MSKLVCDVAKALSPINSEATLSKVGVSHFVTLPLYILVVMARTCSDASVKVIALSCIIPLLEDG